MFMLAAALITSETPNVVGGTGLTSADLLVVLDSGL